MEPDTVIRNEGIKILIEHLGLFEAERFIMLMKREPFNYTEWQREIYQDVPLNTFLQNAAEFRNQCTD